MVYEFGDRADLDEYFRTEPYCVNGTYQHIELYDSTRSPQLQGGTTMKLYNHSQAPNPRRVRIFMAEKGISLMRAGIRLAPRIGSMKGFAV